MPWNGTNALYISMLCYAHAVLCYAMALLLLPTPYSHNLILLNYVIKYRVTGRPAT
jgi:hypothetical protein